MSKKVATILSRLFDPFIMLSLVFVFAFIRGRVTNVFIWILAFGLLIGVPVALIIVAMQKKIVSNWDVSRRRQRPKVLGTLLIIEIINLCILRALISPQVISTLLFIIVAIAGFSIITLWWKISGHTLAAALTSGLIVSWYGWVWWPVLLIVPLVGWARVVRKDHTVLQVISGAAYSWISVVLVYFIIGNIG